MYSFFVFSKNMIILYDFNEEDTMIITFEGLDGVGKTTISKQFAIEHGYRRIERPLYQLFGIENANSNNYSAATYIENNVYNNSDSSELKACLTSLGLIYLRKVIDNKGDNIVLDRGILSNYSFNGTNESLPLFEALLKMGINSDITFLLYASAKTRMERIKSRNIHDKDLSDPDIIDQRYKKIIDFIEQYNIPVIIIDTENKTIAEVLSEVNEKYEEVIRNGNIKSRRKLKPNQ